MLEIIRDPAWQFIGSVLGLTTIALSLWFYFSQRSRKRVLIETIARIPLVTDGAHGIPGLKVTINDTPVEKASILLVRIRNVGNSPILAADVEEPISLILEEGSIVLSADVDEVWPKHLPVSLTFADRTVTVSRHLLNPGDTFTCRILVQDSRGDFTARARIAGVQVLERRKWTNLWLPISSLFGIVLMIGSFYFSPEPKSFWPFDIRAEEIPYALFMTLGVMLLVLTTSWNLRSAIRDKKERSDMEG